MENIDVISAVENVDQARLRLTESSCDLSGSETALAISSFTASPGWVSLAAARQSSMKRSLSNIANIPSSGRWHRRANVLSGQNRRHESYPIGCPGAIGYSGPASLAYV